MIDKEGDLFILYCDICGDAADEDFFEFCEAVNYKKQTGWKSQWHQGEWRDICPECQELED